MLAEPPATDRINEPERVVDRSMLVMQYLLAGIAIAAALLLASVR